ncbi:MAG: hypothetical protein A3I00_09175, partial [Betaproteobacteria bacterium RIFCSPLOWO2_02_FULL_64_12]
RSYARFASEVAQVAGGLASRGVATGDRVLVHLENCPEALIARFACARLGAVCVATNAMAAGPELAYFAEATGAVAAITQPKFSRLASEHCRSLKWLALTGSDAGSDPAPGTAAAKSDSFASLHAEPLPRRAPDPMASASILFTTGTTGRPKGVLWTQANLIWGAKLGALQQGIRADDVCQIFLPLYHVVGLSWSLLAALWAGATVVLQPRFSASRFWGAALAHRATVGSQVLFTSQALSQQPVPSGHCFRQWTAARCLPEHESRFGLKLIGAWGMTEVAAQGIVGDPCVPQHPGSIGRASIAYRIRIADDDGRPVASGETGNLTIGGMRGVSLFSGYFSDPRATEEAFDAGGYFRTGDRVLLHQDGSIQFADRAKDMIKVGGEGVSAAEIERVVLGVAGVKEAAVVGKADPAYGEVAVAFVVPRPDAPASIVENIIEACRGSLAKFKVPREVYLVSELPRMGFGKIAKAALRERLHNDSKGGFRK